MTATLAADQFDMVLRPKHYNSHPSGVEVITITRHLPFDLGNAFKYVARYQHKFEPVEDLKKAVFYLNDTIRNRTRTRVSKRQLAEFFDKASRYLAVEPDGWAKDALTAIVYAGMARTRRRGIYFLRLALASVEVGVPLVEAERAAMREPKFALTLQHSVRLGAIEDGEVARCPLHLALSHKTWRSLQAVFGRDQTAAADEWWHDAKLGETYTLTSEEASISLAIVASSESNGALYDADSLAAIGGLVAPAEPTERPRPTRLSIDQAKKRAPAA